MAEEVCWQLGKKTATQLLSKEEENSYVKMQWKMDGDNLRDRRRVCNGEQQEVLDSPWNT